jgi:hypothetical protein
MLFKKPLIINIKRQWNLQEKVEEIGRHLEDVQAELDRDLQKEHVGAMWGLAHDTLGNLQEKLEEIDRHLEDVQAELDRVKALLESQRANGA